MQRPSHSCSRLWGLPAWSVLCSVLFAALKTCMADTDRLLDESLAILNADPSFEPSSGMPMLPTQPLMPELPLPDFGFHAGRLPRYPASSGCI